MKSIFFDNWESIARTLIITVLAYIALILMLRTAGKRTLSKMNAFDFIITIALGSSLSAVALNKNIPLADGVLAFLIFVLLQYAISWLSVRVKKIKNIVTSRPTMLLYKGELQDEILKRERITIEEVYFAARESGIADLAQVDVMVLETTGKITIIPHLTERKNNTVADVENFPK